MMNINVALFILFLLMICVTADSTIFCMQEKHHTFFGIENIACGARWNERSIHYCDIKWYLRFCGSYFCCFFLFFHFFSYYNHCIINSEEALLLGASFHNCFFLLYVYFALFTQCETLIYDNLILHTFHIKTKWWKNKIECWLFVDENGRLHDI